MKLLALRLQNFRAFREPVTIPFDDLTAFIGRNDVGKSNVLEALDIFFEGGTVSIDPDDASRHDDEVGEGENRGEVRITCIFGELPDAVVLDVSATTSLAHEYLLNHDGQLEIVKVFDCSRARPTASVYLRACRPRVEPYASLMSMRVTDLQALVRRHDLEGECDLRSNVAMRQCLYTHARTTGVDLALAEVDLRIDDRENRAIWEMLRQYLPIFALFQADRASKTGDAEVQDPMKLAIEQALAGVADKIKDIKDRVEAEVLAMARDTVEALRVIDRDLAASLQPTFKSEPNLSGIFKIDLNDERGIPINKRGSGVRRLILLGFFRATIERRRRAQPGVSARRMIVAIEEPETGQHPDKQRAIIETLQALAAEGDQVIMTTHEPAIASLLPLHCLRFVQRREEGRSPIVSRGDETTVDAIAQTLGVLASPLDRNADQIRVVVMVEGPNDASALVSLSRVLHKAELISFDLAEPCPEVFTVIAGGSTVQHWVERRALAVCRRDRVTPARPGSARLSGLRG